MISLRTKNDALLFCQQQQKIVNRETPAYYRWNQCMQLIKKLVQDENLDSGFEQVCIRLQEDIERLRKSPLLNDDQELIKSGVRPLPSDMGI